MEKWLWNHIALINGHSIGEDWKQLGQVMACYHEVMYRRMAKAIKTIYQVFGEGNKRSLEFHNSNEGFIDGPLVSFQWVCNNPHINRNIKEWKDNLLWSNILKVSCHAINNIIVRAISVLWWRWCIPQATRWRWSNHSTSSRIERSSKKSTMSKIYTNAI